MPTSQVGPSAASRGSSTWEARTISSSRSTAAAVSSNEGGAIPAQRVKRGVRCPTAIRDNRFLLAPTLPTVPPVDYLIGNTRCSKREVSTAGTREEARSAIRLILLDRNVVDPDCGASADRCRNRSANGQVIGGAAFRDSELIQRRY